MTELRHIAETVRASQDRALLERERNELGVSERVVALRAARVERARARDRRNRFGAAVAVLAVAATLFLFVRVPRSSPLPLSFKVGEQEGAVGAFIAPTSAPTSLHFSDGSQIDVAASAAVRVTDVGTTGASVVLERGTADTHVVPRSENRWTIAAGPYRVQVKGTRFQTTWDPNTSTLRVAMQEGQVLVTGECLGEGRELRAGDIAELTCGGNVASPVVLRNAAGPDRASLDADASSPSAILTAAIPARVASAVAPRRESQPAIPIASATAAAEAPIQTITETPAWTELARSGRAREAIAAAPIDAIVTTAPAEEIMTLADTARRGGRADVAERAYRAVRDRFAGGETASRATFLLARVLADASRAAEADALFLEYARLAPGGVFAEEASGRLIELAIARGDTAAASARARTYLQRFPRGASADLARGLLLP